MVYKSGQSFLPFCHNPRVRRMDRRTDRRTDGQTDRILIARPRLHSMQRGKNRRSTMAVWTDICKKRTADANLLPLAYSCTLLNC